MKPLSPLLASLLALVAAPALAGPASRCGSEILLQRENADGFVLVDRATGVLRSGTISPSGAVAWQHVVDTGVADVSDAAGGIDGQDGEVIAVTSPMSNRVAMVEIDAAYPSLTRFPPWAMGPRAISEITTAGGEGLMIACSLNGHGNDDILEIWKGFDTTVSHVRHDSGFEPLPVLEPLYSSPTGARVAVFAHDKGGDTPMGICVDDSTMVYSGVTLPGIRWNFITNVHTPHGKLLVVFYRSGGSDGYVVQANLPVGPAMTFSPPVAATFPFPVRSLSPVDPGPEMPFGVLATSSDGTRFAWLGIDAGGTVQIKEEFSGKAAGSFLGGTYVPGRGIARFEAIGKSKTAQVVTVFRKTASGWQFARQTGVPQPDAAQARFATLFYFDSEPLLDEEARLLSIEALPDWTRKSTATPVPATVLREAFAGTVHGLGSPASVPTHPPAGAGYVMTNQVASGLSLAAVRPGMGIFQTAFGVEPPSGSYPTTVAVVPSYNESRYALYYRNADLSGRWEAWPGSLMVPTSGEYLFTLVDMDASPMETSRILRRNYQIDPAGLNAADSDSDGLPDYVEAAMGLRPDGGADSDGDGVSDLEEVLADTDPARSSSFPPDGSRVPVPLGDGIELVGLPFSVAGDEAFFGEEVAAFDMDGSFVGRAGVAKIPVSELPGIVRGAWISSSLSVPENELISVFSGTFFDVHKAGHPHGERSGEGVEIQRFINVPLPPAPDIAFTPIGDDPAADAAGWIAAAKTAYASYAPVARRTDLVPDDTAVAVLVEAMLHAAASDCGFFDPPVALGDFTAFPARVQDAARTPLDRPLVNALSAAGMDFDGALRRAAKGVKGIGGGAAAIRSVVHDIYTWHVAHFETDRSLLLPLDVLRIVFAGGALPKNYFGSVVPGDLATARIAAAKIVAKWSDVMRPTGTWLVEIPETSSGPGVYPRMPGGGEVELFDSHGERFLLEQDRALVPGTQFSVTGFTDVDTASGLPGMEVHAVAASLIPASSSRDLDGNLLDDEWERFFFGATGQDPQSIPPGSAYPLLQHFLEGTDPRANGADEPGPGVPVIFIAMGRVEIRPASSGNGFDLGFAFPMSYLNRFRFVVEASDTMAPGSFLVVPCTPVVEFPVGSGRARITVQTNPATTPKRFYRVSLALP